MSDDNPTKAVRPPARPPLAIKELDITRCPACGKEFQMKRENHVFCSTKCKSKYNYQMKKLASEKK